MDQDNNCIDLLNYHCSKDADNQNEQLVCQFCNKIFTLKKNLLKHLRRCHKADVAADVLTVRKVRCSLKGCEYTCRRMDELRYHIEIVHHIQLYVDSLQFSCDKDFLNWKREEEARSLASFVSTRQKYTKKNGGMRQTLACHRSGHYKPKGSGKYRLKALGSRKIGCACPAAMDVTHTPPGPLTVIYCKTHVGHTQQAEYLSLTREERHGISDAIERGFSINSILESMKESQKLSEQSDVLKRIHLLSRKDLHNISKTLRVGKSQGKKLTADESRSMPALRMSELETTDNVTSEPPINFSLPVNQSNEMQYAFVQGVVTSSKQVDRQDQVVLAPNFQDVFLAPSQPIHNSSAQTIVLSAQDGTLSGAIYARFDQLRRETYKADYMTPKQFALLSARLDTALDLLSKTNITPGRRKLFTKTSYA